MEHLTYLPGTDIMVSRVCLGTWQFNAGQVSPDQTWAALSEQESRAIVDKAIEQGINFFDTAEAYLNSEEVCGRMFEGRRRDLVIATKFGARIQVYTPEEIEKSLITSLQRLQTDYIDLYQVHWANHINHDMEAAVAELKRQQAKGRIRYYGVSNFGPKNLEDFLAAGGEPITNQVSYNLLWRGVEYEIAPLCSKHKIGILPYSPLQQGLLTGKFHKPEDVPKGRRRTKFFNSQTNDLSRHGGAGAEKETFEAIGRVRSICESSAQPMAASSLAWLLQQREVTSIIVGCRNPDQVLQNTTIPKLPQNVVDELSAATEPLKQHFGNNPDLWAEQSRIA